MNARAAAASRCVQHASSNVHPSIKRGKFVKHARHGKKFVVIKTRHGKIVKAHRHGHNTVKVVKQKTRTN